MRKIILVILAITFMSSISLASMSKLYVGNEDGQFILGVESKTNNVDGGAGLEIRTYFEKKGIVVEGKEYGAMLPKVKYFFTLAGINKEGSILRYDHQTTYLRDPEDEQIIIVNNLNCIETGYGRGNYLLFH